MAATSLSVARLLQLRVPIVWQEAVAVVSAADALSATEAIPLTLEHCFLAADGDVHLAPLEARLGSEAISSLQLLEALLQGHASPDDLRALAVTVDDALTDALPKREHDRRFRVDLRWCLSANPRADVAGLAARGLAADAKPGIEPGLERPEAAPRDRPLVRTRPRVPVERVKTRQRRPAVTVRVQRLSPRVALGMAALVLVVASVAGAMGVLGAGIVWPRTYSSRDGDVDPPEMRRPQLGAEPAIATDAVAVSTAPR